MTASTPRNAASTPQKQPAAKVACSVCMGPVAPSEVFTVDSEVAGVACFTSWSHAASTRKPAATRKVYFIVEGLRPPTENGDGRLSIPRRGKGFRVQQERLIAYCWMF